MIATITPENVRAEFVYDAKIITSLRTLSLVINPIYLRHKLFVGFSHNGTVRLDAVIKASLRGASVLELPFQFNYKGANQLNLRPARVCGPSTSALATGDITGDFTESLYLRGITGGTTFTRSGIVCHYFCGMVDKVEILFGNSQLVSGSLMYNLGMFSDNNL